MAAWDLAWLTRSDPWWKGLAALAAMVPMAVAVSALLVRRMIGVGVMDVPGGRSSHDRPTPKGGGVGMVATVLLGTPVLLALLPGGAGRVPAAMLLLPAILLLAAVSWADDLRQFGFQFKLAAQVVASALAVAAAFSMNVLPAWPLLAGIGVVGICWLMLVTNAMNFIDGLNGLASGCTALICLVGSALGLVLHDPLVVATMSMAAAGLVGFLPFNYPRARIFLGDVGSQVCGLLAGSLFLFAIADGAGWRALLVPMMLAGILWDVLLTLGRRLVAGERLTEAHRGHLYQRAARGPLGAARVTLVQWGFVLWGAVCGVLPGGSDAAMMLPAALVAAGPQVLWTLRAWR